MNKEVNSREKIELSKETGPLKMNQMKIRMEMNDTINKLRHLVGSLSDRINHVEDRISGLKHKPERSDHSVRVNNIFFKVCEWELQDIWAIIKRQNLCIIIIKRD